MLVAEIILILVAVAAGGYCVLARTPKPLRDPACHVLICVAHSDDCVIIGAEYAYGAIRNGLSVRVAYLTCSGPHPDSEIARTREREALEAWSKLGVPRENLTFANIPQSLTISGPASQADRDIACAKEMFQTVILSLPQNTAVIIPAHGEMHVDHRTVRKVTLQAIIDAKREDLQVYESPEYNAFLSLVHCPERTIRTILRHIPLMRRLIKPYAGSSNYVNGSPGFVFRDTPSRLAKKRELMTSFTSQDGELLIRLFGYETLYRRLARSDYLDKPNRSLSVPAFGGYCDPSALALGLTLLGLAFLTAHEIARGLTIALTPALPVDKYLALLGGLFAGAYVVRRARRTANLESSWFVWAAALGLISNAL